MEWMAPVRGVSMRHTADPSKELLINRSHPNAYYHNRPGSGQEHISSPRRIRHRRDCFQQAATSAQMLPFFAKLKPCLIGIEACSSAHYWGRELRALGHEVKLMPPIYVKPYVKRGKSDAADAEAICEAVTRPTMRFVEIKSAEQQAILCQHRAREIMVGQRTQLSNTMRGLLGEFGVTLRKGLGYIRNFAADMQNDVYPDLPGPALGVIRSLCRQLQSLDMRIEELRQAIADAAKTDPRIKLLQTIPGIGPINASAIVATIGSAHQFKSGRDLAAWIGLTPLNKSSGGKERLGKISRMGSVKARANPSSLPNL